MKGKISYINLNQAVNMFITAAKLGILTWGSTGIDSCGQFLALLCWLNFSALEVAAWCKYVSIGMYCVARAGKQLATMSTSSPGGEVSLQEMIKKFNHFNA